MGPSVNFDNLRDITGGDVEMESELFQLFLTSSSECIDGLHAAHTSGDENAWRDHAHAFKGICYNLGAQPLGQICKKAQDDCHATSEEKGIMLTDMEAELKNVKQALAEHK